MNAGKGGQALYDYPEKVSDKTEREFMGNQKKGFFDVLLQRIAAVFLGTCLLTAVLMVTETSQAEAAGYGVTVKSCLIQGMNAVVLVSASQVPANDDGLYHLYAQEVYESGEAGTEVASAAAGANAQFAVPLGNNTAKSNLYKKFVVMVKKGGVLQQVSSAAYITNPEAVATHSTARMNVGKKGILPAATMLDTNDLQNLGIHQCTYNVLVGTLCQNNGGTIAYQYNGKTYNFSKAIVGQYDSLVPKLNKRGIQVTLVILNNRTNDLTLIHPLSRNSASASYYAFNTAEQAGVEKLEAVASFLAQRYSGNGHGTVDNWVIGNEVNARADWNYMSAVDVATFANEYAKTVRIFYNGIKSENGNAKVYISIDQQWAKSANAALYYGSRDFLNTFNTIMLTEGNIDWDVAVHPYNVPLYDPVAWSATSRVQHSQNTAYITMQNIDVLTDYLSQSSLLAPKGKVRSVICSEQGYTSLRGESIQAAAVVYGYMQAVANQHIDAFILSRELDDTGEIGQGLANGIVNLNGTHKLAYDYYKNIDGAAAAQYAAAAATIGVSDLSQILTVR